MSQVVRERGLLDITLDVASPVPLYAQLADGLDKAIRDGQLRPGHWLPGEQEIATRLSISRPTVHAAIRRLSTRGLLKQHRGRGTVVV